MSFTDPSASDTLTQRRSNGWGQAMAFPGPPQQTIEDPSDVARESSINVEGANISVGGMSNAVNMSYSPSLNSPVFNYQNNPSNTYFGLQIPYMQMQMQEVYQIMGTQLDANYEARIAALETWRGTAAGSGCNSERTYISGVSLTGGGLVFTRSKITFTEGLLSSCNTATNTTITTTECP